MVRRRRLLAVGGAAAVTLLLAACGGGGGSESSNGKQAKIGLIGPKSGAAQFYWTELSRGIELAQPDVKSAFGVTFDLEEADDKGSPEVASRSVQTLLNEENVDAIFGPSQSGPSLQVAETIQRTGRPWLVPIAAADQIIAPNASPNWAFRTNNNNSDAIAVSANYLWAKPDAKVGIFYGADAYGQSNNDLLKAYTKAHGKTIAAGEVVQPGATDVSPAAQRMKNAGVTSVFIAVSTGADNATVVKALKQVGLAPERTLATATTLTGFTALATPADWKNLVFLEPRDLTGGPFTTLVQRYQAKYGKQPTSAVAVFTTYTAAYLYAQAVAKVGDASKHDEVREAMENTGQLKILGQVFDKPFSAKDHELYEADPSSWYTIGFDPQGRTTTVGKVAQG
ncbi:ABC transporter substrate-binding protein [Actinomadura sp. 1N219]|uniref:ABC transporter substrate-binding protein n=1 Tax=Actinomadura sp. 1N219 TaxID=3375152 RepID=UPI0037A0DA13